jgi:hypothetical protein
MKMNGMKMKMYWIVTFLFNYLVYWLTVLIFYLFGAKIVGLPYFSQTGLQI